MTYLYAVLLVILSTMISAWGSLLFKYASLDGKGSGLGLFLNIKFWMGGFCFFISTIPFLIAVKSADITVLYPFVSLSYIWTIILAKIFLKEKINRNKIIGIIFIIAGVALIGTAHS